MTTQASDNQEEQTGTRQQNLEQKRGRQAWIDIDFIKQVSQERNDDALQKEYRTRASQLNAMIQINGLGQTLGFLKSKKAQNKEKEKDRKRPALPNAYDYLLYHLTQWASGMFPIPQPEPASLAKIPQDYDALLRWITDKANSSEYRRVTTECLAFGLWLRRFAEAELKNADNQEGAE